MFLYNKKFMENGTLVPISGMPEVGYQVEVGDVMILKSGSFPMTVREVIADSAGNLLHIVGIYFNSVSGEYSVMKLNPTELWLHIPNEPGG